MDGKFITHSYTFQPSSSCGALELNVNLKTVVGTSEEETFGLTSPGSIRTMLSFKFQ